MVKEKKITILANGPYLVEGNIPLREKFNVLKTHRIHELVEGRTLPQSETYLLCRCGHSSNPPFCDGAHLNIQFDGTETASNAAYRDRARAVEGPDLTMLDDGRCALAKFCHREKGSAWTLTMSSNNEDCKEEAIIAARDCPTGRLVPLDEAGNEMENTYEPSIDIIQEPIQEVSSGIFVKGGIPLVSESGTVYETRNRYMLCRCGHSYNKPFCDGAHIEYGFIDQKKEKKRRGRKK
jgi:CDGSH-type Zn-finger protein